MRKRWAKENWFAWSTLSLAAFYWLHAVSAYLAQAVKATLDRTSVDDLDSILGELKPR